MAAPGLHGASMLQSDGPSLLSAENLRLVRQAHGWSLAWVAERAGLDPSALSRIERGQRPLTPDLTIRLVRALFGVKAGAR